MGQWIAVTIDGKAVYAEIVRIRNSNMQPYSRKAEPGTLVKGMDEEDGKIPEIQPDDEVILDRGFFAVAVPTPEGKVQMSFRDIRSMFGVITQNETITDAKKRTQVLIRGSVLFSGIYTWISAKHPVIREMSQKLYSPVQIATAADMPPDPGQVNSPALDALEHGSQG